MAGFLTPIALVGGLLLNVLYFTLMIDDWAEQGQNAMMALISGVAFFGMGWQTWSLDSAMGLVREGRVDRGRGVLMERERASSGERPSGEVRAADRAPASGGARFDLPEVDAFTRPYWDAAAEGRLLIRHCAGCDRAHHYPLGVSARTAGARTCAGGPRAGTRRSTPGPSRTATTSRRSASGCRTSPRAR